MGDYETIILSLGGSLIVPNGGINTEFLIKFEKFVRRKVAEGRRFFIVCGGGNTARHYRDAGAEVIGRVTADDLDWLGIHSTRLNAHLVRTIFRDIAHPRIIENYGKRIVKRKKYPVIIAAGWKPGWSTDYCAALLAKEYGSKTVVNLSNIKMLYDKDPKKNKDARLIEKTNWGYFRSIVGNRWDPGMNVPFDPIASKLAEETRATVIILKGDDFNNLEKLFDGKKFEGTVIAPFSFGASFYDRDYFEGGVGYRGYTTSILGRATSLLVNLYRAISIKIFLRPKKLLDVGCATGKMVKYLRILGVEAYGLEVSQYALSKADAKVKPYLKNGDILNIPFEDNYFDTVITFNVIEHIHKENLSKALAECERVSSSCIFHKIHTIENWWMHRFHSGDFSSVSVFNLSWWRDFFSKNEATPGKKFYPRLPLFMETIFILRKKKE